jgi:hypothetical protein
MTHTIPPSTSYRDDKRSENVCPLNHVNHFCGLSSCVLSPLRPVVAKHKVCSAKPDLESLPRKVMIGAISRASMAASLLGRTRLPADP